LKIPGTILFNKPKIFIPGILKNRSYVKINAFCISSLALNPATSCMGTDLCFIFYTAIHNIDTFLK